jgi:hypothetical protein
MQENSRQRPISNSRDLSISDHWNTLWKRQFEKVYPISVINCSSAKEFEYEFDTIVAAGHGSKE